MNLESGALLGVGVGILIFLVLFVIAIAVIAVIGEWKLFKKCGKKGWEAIVPYYADWTLVDISGCHWWYFLLIIGNSILSVVVEDTAAVGVIALIASILSLVSVYVVLCINYNIAKKFHQGVGFAVGMTFLPFIFYLMLGFSEKYKYDSSVSVSPWGLYDFDKKISDNKNKVYCTNCGTGMSGNFCPKCGTNKKGE